MSYVRETIGDHHVCTKCKAKRSEKYMRKTGHLSCWAFPEWVCKDQFCGSAWENQYMQGGSK